jgi:paraquat-inducible protein B
MSRGVAEHPPQARVKKLRWPMLVIVLVPLFAVVTAGYYLYDFLQDHGTQITIRMGDGSGLKPGQTIVAHLGVQIGQVETVDLSPDEKQVLVHVRLVRSAEAFARKGALYWSVRPEISASSISGLGTIASGPFIEAEPGDGDRTLEFTGLDHPPAELGPGLKVSLRAARLEQLQPDSPVYYHGFEVGVVGKTRLSDDATGVIVEVFIHREFAPLVRTNSCFWIVDGINVKGGILTGVQMKLDSVKALLSGGVAFATPEKDIGPPAEEGADFGLYEEPKPEWANWAPKIMLPPHQESATSPSN